MMKTKYREHSLFHIYRENRKPDKRGGKRFRYGIRIHVYSDLNVSGISKLAVAMQQAGYDIKRLRKDGFRFRNRVEAEQFYTVMSLTLGA
jgi:hypothetical protein